jgi:hypothetical protein
MKELVVSFQSRNKLQDAVFTLLITLLGADRVQHLSSSSSSPFWDGLDVCGSCEREKV